MGDSDSKVIQSGMIVVEEAVTKFIPGVGIGKKLLSMWFGDANEAWQNAYRREMEGLLFELERRVVKIESQLAEEGVDAETPSAIQLHTLAQEFFDATKIATTNQKREILIRAWVAQFDPRVGDVAVRRQIWETVRRLSDVETSALELLGDCVVRVDRDGKLYRGPFQRPISPLSADVGLDESISHSQAVALVATLQAMCSANQPLVYGEGGSRDSSSHGIRRLFSPTPWGRIVVSALNRESGG